MTQAEFLKKIRSYFDDTQKEFAQRIGVSTILISMIESGQKSISKKLIVKIANELNVDPAYLSPSLMDEFPIYAFSERVRTILKNIKRKYPLPGEEVEGKKDKEKANEDKEELPSWWGGKNHFLNVHTHTPEKITKEHINYACYGLPDEEAEDKKTEVTMDEIAEKFGVDVEDLKIKKEG